MAHHRDPNAPLKMDAAAITASEKADEIKMMNQRIADLTPTICGEPQFHDDLVAAGTQVYSRKAKRLLAWKRNIYKIAGTPRMTNMYLETVHRA